MTEIDGQALEQDCGRAWLAHAGTMTSLLVQCRRHFRGDLDRMLVLCVIGDRTLSAKNIPDDFTHQDLGRTKTELPEEPVNLQFISDFSGIPRETVRRKLLDLQSLGWIERDERGCFAVTKKAAADLAPLADVTTNYLAKMKTLSLEKKRA